MIIGREGLCVLETWVCKQDQIHPGSLDWGVIATPVAVKEIGDACRMIAKDLKSTKMIDKKHGIKSWMCFIPYERSDYYPGQVDGCLVEVTLYEGRCKGVAYFTITLEHTRRPDVSYFK